MKRSPLHKYDRQLRAKHVVLTFFFVLLLAALTSYGIQRFINASTIALTVDHPIQYSNGQYPFLPGTNRHFVIVTTHISNHTPETFHFAPVLQTYLTDASGLRYDMAPALSEDPIKAGEIAPGETRSGQISFNVLKNSSGLTLHFKPINTSKEIIVQL